MKRRSEQAAAWVVDYSAARAHAIRWLGDRYLLARPINASHSTWWKAPLAILQAKPADIPAAVAPHTRR
jgi:hypothetical protein